MREIIGARLRSVRKHRRITATNLADNMGIRGDVLSLMERGHQSIPAELLADWCLALDISANAILTPESDQNSAYEIAPSTMQRLSELSTPYRKLVLQHLDLVYALAQGEQTIDKA
ncbi:helix-turn-helix domain-containing protein [Microbulbifer discodermiae]|uniref:helix-turn-helix domain-containing protein n=1 Tax=Microbulbifer sp. 2201CG32-9 TaxID=3232309 RepID=UPI00345C455B